MTPRKTKAGQAKTCTFLFEDIFYPIGEIVKLAFEFWYSPPIFERPYTQMPWGAPPPPPTWSLHTSYHVPSDSINCTLSLSLSLSHTHIDTHIHSHKHSLHIKASAYIYSLPLCFSVTALSLSLFHTNTHTHTHTRFLSLPIFSFP